MTYLLKPNQWLNMTPEQLKKLIKRRHPEYKEALPHWTFLDACYKGGREWFSKNIFRYLKEGDKEFKDRVERAYRFNHSREVVDLVDKYLFKVEIDRNEIDAPDELVMFWDKSTKSGLNADQFARQVSRKSSIFGSVWVVVDSSKSGTLDGSLMSIAESKKDQGRIYAYTVNPDRVLDFAYDDNGDLLWVLIYEQHRDDSDPFESTGEYIDRYRLWTKQDWSLFTAKKNGSDTLVTEVENGVHDLGVVPVFRVDNQITDEKWKAPSLIGDIAYLDKAVANYLSNLDAIIQDQTFSQLAMPAQGLMPGEDGYDKLIEMGTKRIFLYDGERGGEPSYISPDPKQANVILDVVSKIINEIYHTVGMAGERTKQDNAVGIDNSSGVAKAFDFERVNALLISKAASLEHAEKKLATLVGLWAGIKNIDADDMVVYSRSFDVRGLYDEFTIATQLALIEAPDSIRREQMDHLVDKLFPMLSETTKKEIESELVGWPPKVEMILPTNSLLNSPETKKSDDSTADSGKKKGATNSGSVNLKS